MLELLNKAASDAVMCLREIAINPDEKAADRVRACDILLTRAGGNFEQAPQVVIIGDDNIPA